MEGKVQLEVGDKVLIKTPYGDKVVTISRVTKTKACSSSGAEFKRKIGERGSIDRWSPIPCDLCSRKLIK